MADLISIIVPVYNVEKYVEQCIRSIQAQTYTNIEIIIINDGSTDNSYNECVELARGDNRIRLLSKENGGLSSARNYGIKQAKGAYFAFIDSDDFVENTFIERLVSATSENDSDIACCNYDLYDGVNYAVHKIRVKEMEVWDNDKALDTMLYDCYYRCYACNKLFKRELWKNIAFPEGRLYEDIITMYNLYKSCKKVTVLPDALYHYRIRNDSITHGTKNDRVYDILVPIKTIYNDTNSQNMKNGCIRYYLFLINELILMGVKDKNIQNEFRQLLNKDIRHIIFDNNLAVFIKCELVLIWCSYTLYECIYSALRRRT